MAKPISITTAIAYVNAKPHIGYALECIYADVLARHFRSVGKEVFFQTGTDENGQKMARAAEKVGKDPQAYVDEMVEAFKALKQALHLSYDEFVRTSSPQHAKVAQAFWMRCFEKRDIYKKAYQGLYCVGCESFKTEKELIDGICPDHKTKPELIEEENYFFRLSKYSDQILRFFADQPDFVYPRVKFNEIKSLVETEGLEDISISRSKKMLQWGIEVPNDPTQVMYVWFDALTNYLTGVGFDGTDTGEWTKRWPTSFQIIGKEINRFHTAWWPAMLMSAGLPVLEKVGVHGWITVDGQKMSKTIGNVLDPFELVKQYGTEPLRYFLMREIPFDRDGDFSHKRFIERYNSDLANDLGNLVSRSTNMIEKFCAGVVDPKTIVPADMARLDAQAQVAKSRACVEGFHFDQALEAIWEMIRAGNGLIDVEKPWKLIETDAARVAQVMTQLHIYLSAVAEALIPFMPDTAQAIQKALTAPRITKAQPMFPKLSGREAKV